MKIAYKVDAGGVVRSEVQGTLLLEDLESHIRRVAADPERADPMRELFDARGVGEVAFGTMAVRRPTKLLATLVRSADARVAIVASCDLMYGMGRAAEALMAGHERHEVRVFRAVSDAESWLLQPDTESISRAAQ